MTPKQHQRKIKRERTGVNKVASNGKSHDVPKKGRNESEPENANVSRDSEVAAAQQAAPIKKIQQQEKERKRVYVLGDSIINGVEEKGYPRGGGGVLGLRTYGDVPLENLKSYPVPESNSRK